MKQLRFFLLSCLLTASPGMLSSIVAQNDPITYVTAASLPEAEAPAFAGHSPQTEPPASQSAITLKAPDDYLAYDDLYKKKKKKKKKKKSESEYSLKDHLWYGGGIGLGFGSTAGYSQFGFGISPMVGYKIIGPLSVGPRLSIDYTSVKYQGLGTYNLFDVELSLFARVKVFKGLFIQGEIGTVTDQYLGQNNTGNLEKVKRTRPAQYVGLGYNFSNGEGGFGQEISIMYDFYIANDINAYENPWQYRFAITFGF